MERDNRANRYTPETRERAVRMVYENLGSYPDRATAIRTIAPKIGCSRASLRRWVEKYEAGALDEDTQAADLIQAYDVNGGVKTGHVAAQNQAGGRGAKRHGARAPR